MQQLIERSATSSSGSVVQLYGQGALAHWHVVWPLIAPAVAVSGGRYTQEMVQAGLASGKSMLWAWFADGGMKAAVITEINDHPSVRICDLLFCGGREMPTWLTPMLEAIEDHARGLGCSRMAVVGRAGWERMLPGYRRTMVVCEKDL